MSSFLDSTGLSRLVSKIKDYFAKKDGTYPDMTVGKVSITNASEGSFRQLLCVDSSGNIRQLANIQNYTDSGNGVLLFIGSNTRFGAIRLTDANNHYGTLRVYSDIGASDLSYILRKPGIIASKPNDGNARGGTGTPIYVKNDGELAVCTDVAKEFYIDGTGGNVMYKTIAYTGINTTQGISRISLEIGPLGANYGANSQNAKIYASLSSYGTSASTAHKLKVLGINYPDLTSRVVFYTLEQDGLIYIVIKMVEYSAGAYVKVTSHGSMAWDAGVFYSAGSPPGTLDSTNVEYSHISATTT